MNPSPADDKLDEKPDEKQKVRLGLILFSIYSLFYFAFVMTMTFAADTAEIEIVAGLNLAIVWGFGLIGLALLLACLYGYLCRRA